tara:strand:+ start:334 stop:564 length:231 start_codon:yes stop_codon:yes gene_type:complete
MGLSNLFICCSKNKSAEQLQREADANKFSPNVFIDGIGDVYIPEKNNEKQIRRVAKLVLEGKLPIDMLDIRYNINI